MLKKREREILYSNIQNLMDKIHVDFGGGCGVNKAFVMAWLIAFYKMKNTLDIGVYRGRSLFPQALSHKKYTQGRVFGVDPWTKDDAKENGNPELKKMIDEFVDKTDFELIFEAVDKFNQENDLQAYCELVRMRSEDAANIFLEKGIRFDLIHVDGNHDTNYVINDINSYLPLLNKNGFIIMDDISWDSVKPALKMLENKLSAVSFRMDGENDYAVFWKNHSRAKLLFLQFVLKYFIKR